MERRTHLPKPFIVVATQNPFEYEGTYPLPESQLDRFLLRMSIGYPDREIERQVMATHRAGEPVDQLKPVVTTDSVSARSGAFGTYVSMIRWSVICWISSKQLDRTMGSVWASAHVVHSVSIGAARHER